MKFKNTFNWLRRKAGITIPLNQHFFIKKDEEGKELYQYDYLDSENKRISIVLKLIYTSSKGHKFYQFVNPIQMTMERSIAASAANKEFGYNMTVDELHKLCDAALQSNNSRDYNGVAINLNEIKVRASKLVEYETTLKLGAMYFLMDDEHPGRYNPITIQRKIDIIKADDDLRAFFLQTVWDMVKPYTDLSSKDLMDYLTAAMDPRR